MGTYDPQKKFSTKTQYAYLKRRSDFDTESAEKVALKVT